jgi:hypothetical protein
MQNGMKKIACVPSRRGETAVSQHKLNRIPAVRPESKSSQSSDTPLKQENLKRGDVSLQKHPTSEKKSKSFKFSPPSGDILTYGNNHLGLMLHKLSDEKSTEEEKDAPIPLSNHSRITSVPTEESTLFKNALRGLFRDKIYPFRLSTVLNMSSSAAGIVNSVINVYAVGSSTDFVSLAAIFDEFFVVRMDCHWQPNGHYTGPLGQASPQVVLTSLPLGCASLAHTSIPYTSVSALGNNFHRGYHNTGDPFKYTWTNSESPENGDHAVSTTQGWCTTSNASYYQGMVQFMSQAAPPALPASQVLGSFMVDWFILFRTRD